MSELVHCFWSLQSGVTLEQDFKYHVLPDACANILFDQSDKNITAITALQTEHRILNLGKKFHYVGVQLLPGVWRGNPEEIRDDLVTEDYCGELPLVSMNESLISCESLESKNEQLASFVQNFIEQALIAPNPVISKILQALPDLQRVSDMAEVAHQSPRQLQRTIKQSIGVSPHDFLKILRVQQAFRDNYLDYYADQSHYIHSFRKLTGYTPARYNKTYDV